MTLAKSIVGALVPGGGVAVVAQAVRPGLPSWVPLVAGVGTALLTFALQQIAAAIVRARTERRRGAAAWRTDVTDRLRALEREADERRPALDRLARWDAGTPVAPPGAGDPR